jgi:hypothetical protein
MTRVSEATASQEQALFVGRKRELTIFNQWFLADDCLPDLLNVCGRGGVGKTTLLQAFRRIAERLGRSTILVDARDFGSTVQGLLSALTGSMDVCLDDVVVLLNEVRPLVMVDTAEALGGGIVAYIQEELFPRLDTRVRVVIAGRHPLSRSSLHGDRWRSVARPLRLEGFSEAETREYLGRRGVTEPGLVRRIAQAAGGNPLAVSLATDMVLQFDARDLSFAPEWHLGVRWLAERLLHDIEDSGLRELVEACAVVHQFDESTLTAISGREDVSGSFDQLCRLSVVKPSEHGLQLHDDVRRHVAADLSWRQPGRYSLLRSRALAHYRERLRTAPLLDREWLASECFYLWSNALMQQIFFDPGEPGRICVEPAGPNDTDEIRRLFALRTASIFAGELGGEVLVPPAGDEAFLEAILRYPASRVRIAREEGGRVMGFSTVLPVSRESLPILELDEAAAPLVRAYCSARPPARLPAIAADATAHYLCHVIHATDTSGPVRAALLRNFSGLFAASGTYLCSTWLPSYKALLEACGFERVPAARNYAWGSEYPVDGYRLELSGVGFERWIEAMVNGDPLPSPRDRVVIERELRATLPHWDDSDWLARSSLSTMLQSQPGTDRDGPRRFREEILAALRLARNQAAGDQQLAYEALELAYFSNRRNRKQAARSLAVSRATFYRLVRRGFEGLAEALARPR